MFGKEFGNNIQDVTDPTDWLNTPLTSFKDVDAALRCEVCKDFYATPMITACSHTFCSLCIRRCLVTDGKCPTCRASEQEVRLRSNWAMEGLVEAFIKARPAALEHAQKRMINNNSPSPKRKFYDADLDSQNVEPRQKRTRSSKRISEGPRERNGVIMTDEDGDDDYQLMDGSAECPICETRMKIEMVFPHLENCSGQRASKRIAIPPSTEPSASQNRQSSSLKPLLKLERLAHLNYSLLKETALRKKLVEQGIPAVGSRQQLERRHIEWVTLWNANCDSSRPRKKGELLNDLDIWEKAQGLRAPSLMSSFNTGNQVLSKDFDGVGWATKHGQSYQDLIASARRGVSKKRSPKSSESRHSAVGGESGGAVSFNTEVDTLEQQSTDPFTTDPALDTSQQDAINNYEPSTTKYLSHQLTLNSNESAKLVGNKGGSFVPSVSSQHHLPPGTSELEEGNDIISDLDITTARSGAF